MYTMDGINWEYADNGKEYKANYDLNTVVRNQISNPFMARAVRIKPTQW